MAPRIIDPTTGKPFPPGTPRKRTLDEALDRATKKVELLRARAQLKQEVIRRTKLRRLRESWDAFSWLAPFGDAIDRLRPDGDFALPVSTAMDRRYGDNWPFWRSWVEHSRLRAASRLLYGMSPLVAGAIRGVGSYVIGKGMRTRAVGKRPDTPRPLLQAVQEVLDEWVRQNDWLRRQRVLFTRSEVDGEYFVRLFPRDDGMTFVRAVDATHVIEPAGQPRDVGSYGVITDPDDTEDTRGFFVSHTGSVADGEYVSSQLMRQYRANVDDGVKRGCPTLSFDMLDLYKTAGRLIENMGQGAAIQAAIAFVRQHESAPADMVADFTGANADYTQQRPFTGTTEQVTRFTPGTIVDMDAGQSFVSTEFAANVGNFVSAAQALLRAVAVKWNAPEWITSADSSNNNFACHDSETELLTRRGWLRYDQIRYGDLAGTMSPETGAFEWQEIRAIHVHDHDGEMVRLCGKHNLDVLVTPNHRMWRTAEQFRRTGGGPLVRDGLKPWSFCRADELRHGDILPFACLPKGGVPAECFEVPAARHARKYLREESHPQPKTLPMGPFLAWLGWWVSEGWAVSNPGRPGGHVIGLSQTVAHAAECDMIRSAAAALRGAYNIREYTDRTNGMQVWQLADKSLWSWLRRHCGTGSYTKRLPDFVHDLPAAQLEGMLQAMVKGDGHERPSGDTSYYFTVSGELADQVQSIALQCGRIAHRLPPMANGVLPVSMRPPKRRVRVSTNHISRVPYRGTVWCVTVPNGLIVTRRNGKSIITGNSALVAESPFVRGCEQAQQDHQGVFLWAAEESLAHYCRRRRGIRAGGRLYDYRTLRELMGVQVTPPTVEARDKASEASTNRTYVELGIKSRQTVAQEQSLDWETEERNNEEYEKKHGEQGVPQKLRAGEGADEEGDGRGGDDRPDDTPPGQPPPGADAPSGDDVPAGQDDLAELESLLAQLEQGGGEDVAEAEGEEEEGAYAIDLTEGCVANRTGKGYHDEETGHPCSPDDAGGADEDESRRGKDKQKPGALASMARGLAAPGVNVFGAIAQRLRGAGDDPGERERQRQEAEAGREADQYQKEIDREKKAAEKKQRAAEKAARAAGIPVSVQDGMPPDGVELLTADGKPTAGVVRKAIDAVKGLLARLRGGDAAAAREAPAWVKDALAAGKGQGKAKAKAPPPPPPPRPTNRVQIDADLHPEGQKQMRALGAALKGAAHLKPEQKKYYFEQAQAVLKNASPRMLQRINAHLHEPAHFAESLDAVREHLSEQYGGSPATVAKLRAAKSVAGAYARKGGKAKLVLDGDKGMSAGGEFGEGTARGTYAHEFAHAVDGPHGELSRSPGWQAAFKAEIAGGGLTRYATTSASEGFAEFGRLLLSGAFPADKVRRRFPRCYAYWKGQGLVEGLPAGGSLREEEGAAPLTLPELFDAEGRVDLPDGGHADVYLQGEDAGAGEDAEAPAGDAPAVPVAESARPDPLAALVAALEEAAGVTGGTPEPAPVPLCEAALAALAGGAPLRDAAWGLRQLGADFAAALAAALERDALLEATATAPPAPPAPATPAPAPPRVKRKRVERDEWGRITAVVEEEAEVLTEGCVPNRTGKGYHDEDTGHPCKPGGGGTAPAAAPAKARAAAPAGRARPRKAATPAESVAHAAPAEKAPSEKALRAKESFKRIDARLQRFSEEHNEARFAAAVGGSSLPDNEPVDVVLPGHGVELKTMVDNDNGKITMKEPARRRKEEWERQTGGTFHTVIIDDRECFAHHLTGAETKEEKTEKISRAAAAFLAGDTAAVDLSKRKYLYRRGYGSFRVGNMHVASGPEEIAQLLKAGDDELPPVARRPGRGEEQP